MLFFKLLEQLLCRSGLQVDTNNYRILWSVATEKLMDRPKENLKLVAAAVA